ncbi:MAG: OmpA/MotB family protein [Pirellulales bacterium]
MAVVSLRFSCVLSGALFGAGCAFVPQSDFDACQAQNRTLVEQTRAQLAEIENLKTHSRDVEDQLMRAERGTLADGGWRDPFLARGTTGVSSAVQSRLAELAGRYPDLLQVDARSGVSKLDTDILFASGEAQLKPEAERLLGEFAAIFQSPETRDLKIMVVGHTDDRKIAGRNVRDRYPNNWHLSTARALAVADQLRKSGIPEDRMGVAGFGQYQPLLPNATPTDRQRNRRVEIFVMGPDAPIVGWTKSSAGVY